ncbi:MAG: Uma2 family endonuclease [Synechococcales cyanobacterium CRU_2_2]|nr:Uma2 family endonuclease [Synechococcales cyanobacterium CRU_2_2]
MRSPTTNTPEVGLSNGLLEPKVWTDAAFMALPDDGHRYEIVGGELVEMGNSGALHGYVCSTLMIVLGGYVRLQNLGAMFDSSTAFKMINGNKRAPDLSCFAKERLQGITVLPTGFLDGAPDLVVEVLSPGNTVEEMDRKVEEYFENGTHLLWMINCKQQYVLVYRSASGPDRLLKVTDVLEGEDVVPGFGLAIADLFQKLSF